MGDFQSEIDLIVDNEICDEKVLMIDSNSTVWQLSLTEFDLKRLIKLPKAQKYFGHVDKHGVLYFIDGAMQKPVTQLDPKNGQFLAIKYKYNMKSVNTYAYKDYMQVGQNHWFFSQALDISFDLKQVCK